MPELPEVEAAMDTLRRRARGRTIARVELLHPALHRRVRPAQVRGLVGGLIQRVERRGKHQLLHLEDGRIVHVHFRMNGDWAHGTIGAELPRFARAVIDFDDGTQLILVDSRALGTFDIHPAGAELDLGLGPDAADPDWTAEQLGAALASKRGPIKPALLDQRLVAGLGNIYAAEALWRARISPFARSDSLGIVQVRALRKAIAAVIVRATGSRYTDDDTVKLDVYDKEGVPCRRCGTPIERVVQAGRSTYFCPQCQPHGGVVTKVPAKKVAAKKVAAKRVVAKKVVAKKVAAKKKAGLKKR
jgi:formamidopyrimidine-DNA glycosylase